MPSIRVNDELYRELNKVAGELRMERGRRVSMEDVLAQLLKSRKLKPSDFAGVWKITDREAEDIMKGLRGFWSRVVRPTVCRDLYWKSVGRKSTPE